jgi:hypothetical protein
MELFGLDTSKKHLLRTNIDSLSSSDRIEPSEAQTKLRKSVEPWLSAIFQSDHLSLLVGAGLTSAVTTVAKSDSQGMGRIAFTGDLGAIVKAKADESSNKMHRGDANLEDDIRIALDLLTGLRILTDARANAFKDEIDTKLNAFIKAVLASERNFFEKLRNSDVDAVHAFNLLKSFILSFASRATSRERLNIFTTNYDRFIELACDETGVLLLDRFKGKLRPVFRNTRLELDFHYNPPGIRGEPRYVEGVSRLTKLHGSIDWKFELDRIVRSLIPFGASEDHPEIPEKATDQAVIYPNSAKDIETAFYPYAELFRDFSSSVCQPNSALVTYGYGFGDSHINRVIEDMLKIPSTHVVIIAWDMEYNDADSHPSFGAARKRILDFLSDKNDAQITLLIGEHFGDLSNLVQYYLPKSAIDRLTVKMQKLKENRGEKFATDPAEAEIPIIVPTAPASQAFSSAIIKDEPEKIED